MKKLTALLLSAALCVGLLAGCGSDSTNEVSSDPNAGASANTNTNTSTPENDQTEELSGTVVTLGSTSMESVMGALAEQFGLDHSGVTVSVEGGGSGAGVEAALNGTADIGLASRALKDEEKAGGLVETVLALDGIAIIVNAECAVEDLTVEQIAQIFTGEITNWSEVGGADLEIACIGRESGSGTRDGFESITGTEDLCQLKQELTSTGAVIEAVRGNAQAIGYASLASAQGQDGIKILTVGGVMPSEKTVLDGTYEIQRPFVLATKEGVELSAAAQAFFDWAVSADAADLIRSAGAVPMA